MNTCLIMSNLLIFIQLRIRGLARHYETSGKDVSPLALLTVTLLLVLFVAIVFYFTWRKERYWSNKQFPPNLPFTDDNLLKAYLLIAGALLRRDRVNFPDKMAYITGYLIHRFPEIADENILNWHDAANRVVSLKSVTFWLNKHSVEMEERWQLIDFMIALADRDGFINDDEVVVIRVISAGLRLEPSRTEEKLAELRAKAGVNVENKSSDTRKRRAAAVLGLDENAELEEIKRVYRALVKLYHPDKFMQESSEVRERDAEKFREIQEAYDYLNQHGLYRFHIDAADDGHSGYVRYGGITIVINSCDAADYLVFPGVVERALLEEGDFPSRSQRNR